MKIVLKILLPVIVVALGVLGAMKLKSMKPEVKPSETEVPSPLVEVVEAVAESVELRVNAQGTVVPRTESRLVAEVSGRVVEVAPVWVDGGFFEAEQVLLRLDTTDYELAKREAEVRVAQAELRLAQEEADAEIARRDWKTERGEEPPPPLAVREPQVAEARTDRKAGIKQPPRDAADETEKGAASLGWGVPAWNRSGDDPFVIEVPLIGRPERPVGLL